MGREDAATEQDISELTSQVEGAKVALTCLTSLCFAVLHGLDLESEHCMFENQSGTVTMVPFSGAQCSVNGVLVSQPSQLNQGKKLISTRVSGL